jgi:hypothetical protein
MQADTWTILVMESKRFFDSTNALPLCRAHEQISIKTESAFDWQLIGARNMIIRTPNAHDVRVAEEAQ